MVSVLYLVRRADGQPRVDVGVRDGIAGRRAVTVEKGEEQIILTV